MTEIAQVTDKIKTTFKEKFILFLPVKPVGLAYDRFQKLNECIHSVAATFHSTC